MVHKKLTANSHLAKLNICLCVLHFIFTLKDLGFEGKDDKVLTFIGTFHYYSLYLIKIYDWTLQIKSPLAWATLVYNGKSNILFSVVFLLFWGEKKNQIKFQLKMFFISVTSRGNRSTTDKIQSWYKNTEMNSFKIHVDATLTIVHWLAMNDEYQLWVNKRHLLLFFFFFFFSHLL